MITRTHSRPLARPAAVAVIGVVVAVIAVLVLVPSGDGTEADGFTASSDLSVGDCFLYPANDDLIPARVQTVSCAEIHFAEVYGTTAAGDTDSCVDLFEAYTGAENYWATNYIIGFLDVDDSRMHCYLYAAADFAGSLAR